MVHFESQNFGQLRLRTFCESSTDDCKGGFRQNFLRVERQQMIETELQILCIFGEANTA